MLVYDTLEDLKQNTTIVELGGIPIAALDTRTLLASPPTARGDRHEHRILRGQTRCFLPSASDRPRQANATRVYCRPSARRRTLWPKYLAENWD